MPSSSTAPRPTPSAIDIRLPSIDKDNAFLDPTPIPAGDPVPRFEYRGRVYENVPRAQFLAADQLYGYTVFGKVIAGMDVVNKIKTTPTGSGGPFPTDVPKTPVTILKATLEK